VKKTINERLCKSLVAEVYRRMRKESLSVILRELINTVYGQGRAEGEKILPVLEPVTGDILPPINSEVYIHLASCDKWVKHTVVGYYVWGPISHQVQGDPKESNVHRVFVRVMDSEGYFNARLLNDIRYTEEG
jgi:hypothetical protein